MIIPEKIKLMSQEIDITLSETLVIDQGSLGVFDPNNFEIKLDSSNNLNGSKHRTALERVYLHELVHAILYMMTEEELYENEKFVDTFAGLLHQALQYSEQQTK